MQCREVAVSISCRRHERWEEDEVDERSSSHVVALQKPDGRPSPEQMNMKMSWFRRPALPIPVLAGTGTEKPWMQRECGDFYALETKKQMNVEVCLSFISGQQGAMPAGEEAEEARRYGGKLP
jgi:hypothetical protein